MNYSGKKQEGGHCRLVIPLAPSLHCPETQSHQHFFYLFSFQTPYPVPLQSAVCLTASIEGVERLTQADRITAIASAAAHDLNDELTIILNGATLSIENLEPGHPARSLLRHIQWAAQRCVWKTSGLLNYGNRRGHKPVPIPMERLMLEAD